MITEEKAQYRGVNCSGDANWPKLFFDCFYFIIEIQKQILEFKEKTGHTDNIFLR